MSDIAIDYEPRVIELRWNLPDVTEYAVHVENAGYVWHLWPVALSEDKAAIFRSPMDAAKVVQAVADQYVRLGVKNPPTVTVESRIIHHRFASRFSGQ